MKVKLLLLLILLPLSVIGQQKQILQIRDFKGLNTRAGDFQIKMDESRIAHNVDWGKNLGSATKRLGYDSVSGIAGMDSIVDGSLYPAYFSDGRQRLFFVGDSAGVGYGNIYATGFGSANIEADSSERLLQYWSVQNPTSFSQYRNDVYMVNGSHRGAVYDFNSGTIREFPLRAPGELRVVPLDVSGSLNGEYRYVIETVYPSTSVVDTLGTRETKAWSVVSAPVKVKNSKVLLTGFQYIRGDSIGDLTNVESYSIKVSGPAQDNTLYWITINTGDSVGYTSDGTATWREIVEGLITAINGDSPGMADTITADSTDGVDFGRFRIYGDVPGQNIAIELSSNLDSSRLAFVYIYIWRSDGNVDVIDDGDSLWINSLSSISITDSTILDTLTFIDDSILFEQRAGLLSKKKYGRDSLGALSSNIYGQPGYVSGDTVNDTSLYGVYQGWSVEQSRYMGQVYVCTFYDTITGFESDTGRALFIYRDTISNMDSSVQQYTVSLPKIPNGETGLKVRLYRAPLIRIEHDTTWISFEIPKTPHNDRWCRTNVCFSDGRCKWFNGVWGTDIGKVFGWPDSFVVVSVEISCAGLAEHNKINNVRWFLDSLYVGTFRMIGEYASTVATVSDSMRFDSLQNNEFVYSILNPVRKSSPVLLKNLFSFQDRMFGVDESRLYYSNLDAAIVNQSISGWGDFQYVPINESDGDAITGVYPAQGAIRVFKNRTSYNVSEIDAGFLGYDMDGEFWVGREVTGTHGIIAQKSLQAGFGGYYYLSDVGVLFETASDNLARRFGVDLISKNLDNFEGLSVNTLSGAQSFYLPKEQKYMLIVNDTNFVWDEKAQKWSTWDMTFSSAALYGVESGVKFVPGDTMYFVKPGGSVLYRYGSNDSDHGVAADFVMKMGNFLIDENEYTITGVGLWVNSTDTISDPFLLQLNDEAEVSVAVDTIVDITSGRYIKKGMKPNIGKYFSLKIGTSAVNGLVNTQIDGIDVYYIRQGLPEIK